MYKNFLHYVRENDDMTIMDAENKYGRFVVVSIREYEDVYNRFDGYISCEMQVEYQTYKAKAKVLYQRYVGALNAYKVMKHNYSEDSPEMRALWRQVSDAHRRYQDAKEHAEKVAPKNISKVLEARRRDRETIAKRMEKVND